MSSVRSAVASASAVPVSLLALLVALAGSATAQSGIPGPAAAHSGIPRPAVQSGTAGPAAAQGGSADASYYVRDVATGRCLAGTRIATCGTDGTEWVLRDHGDGTVQFQQAGSETQASSPRCLTLPAMLSYPAAVRMSACDAAASSADSADAAPGAAGQADRWRIEGWVDGPVTIAHAYPPAGRLFVADSAVRVSNNSSAIWVLDPVVTVKARR